jgi:hypothetical protein
MTRAKVKDEVQAGLLVECRRRCTICWGLNKDFEVKRGQVAHVDRDNTNASEDNLVFLCLPHHDEYDSKPSQSKGWTPDEVRRHRAALLAEVSRRWSDGTLAPPLAAPALEGATTGAPTPSMLGTLNENATGPRVFRSKTVASNTREAIGPLLERVSQVVAAFAGDPKTIQDRCSQVLPWLLNTIEDTTGRYGEAFRASLFQFHGYASRLCSELPAVGDGAAMQRLQYQVRTRRDQLSEAAQTELAAALSSPPPLSLVLSHIHEHEGMYFVATVKNETEEQIINWAIQIEVPPLLVNGLAQGGHVPEESDKRKAVFRTTPRTVETRPLWHGASFPFKVQYQLSETNQGLRTFNVRATAYVGGRLVVEQIKGVDELSTYFLPAAVARREAQVGLLMSATRPGGDVVTAPATAPAPIHRDDKAAFKCYVAICSVPDKGSDGYDEVRRRCAELFGDLGGDQRASYVATTAYAWYSERDKPYKAVHQQLLTAQEDVQQHLLKPREPWRVPTSGAVYDWARSLEAGVRERVRVWLLK